MKIDRDDRDFIAVLWDDLLRDEGAALTQAEVRERLRPRVVEMLARHPRDLDTEADQMLTAALAPIRKRRANSLRRELQWIYDYWLNPEDGATAVRALERNAYPLGTQDGEDKTLAYWTVADLESASIARRMDVAAAKIAADEFDAVVQLVTAHMSATGAARLIDVPALTEGLAA